MLEQVAIIAAMRFRARQPLFAQHLVSSLHFGIIDALLRRQRPGDGQPELEPENPFRPDLEAVDYDPLPIDSVVLDFLNTGDLDTKGFEASLPDLKALEVGREFRERLEAISASIWGKFGSLTADELARPQSLLDGDEIARVGGADLGFYLDILEMHGLKPNRSAYELRWAQKIPVAHGMLSEFRLDRLKTDEAKKYHSGASERSSRSASAPHVQRGSGAPPFVSGVSTISRGDGQCGYRTDPERNVQARPDHRSHNIVPAGNDPGTAIAGNI